MVVGSGVVSMSRLAVKYAAGPAHHFAQLLIATGRPRNDGEAVKLGQWIDLFESGRVKLEPADCRRLLGLMSAVCRPSGVAQAKELEAAMKRLAQ